MVFGETQDEVNYNYPTGAKKWKKIDTKPIILIKIFLMYTILTHTIYMIKITILYA